MVHRRDLGDARELGQQGQDLGLDPEQQKPGVGMPLEREVSAAQDNFGSVIAAHRVKGDRDRAAHRSRALARLIVQAVAGSAGTTSRPL